MSEPNGGAAGCSADRQLPNDASDPADDGCREIVTEFGGALTEAGATG